jgi:hypothetical protein
VERLDTLTTTQAGLATQLAAELQNVTVSRTARWPQSGSEFDSQSPLLISAEQLARWFELEPARAPGEERSAGPAQYPELWPKTYLAIRPVTGELPSSSGGDPDHEGEDPTRVGGIPYRLNLRGRLLSCRRPCRDATEDLRHTVLEGNVAQLGGVAVLPVRNPPLGSSTFGAQFNRDGTLVSAGFAQRRAPPEQASAIAADTTAAIAPLLDPTQRLQRETERLQALQEHRAATAALNPAQPSEAAQATASPGREYASRCADLESRGANHFTGAQSRQERNRDWRHDSHGTRERPHQQVSPSREASVEQRSPRACSALTIAFSVSAEQRTRRRPSSLPSRLPRRSSKRRALDLEDQLTHAWCL